MMNVGTTAHVDDYERRLAADWRFALSEGSRFFEGRSEVQDALLKITKRLDELGVAYALAGGLALLFYGLRRFTEDVDLLVSPEGLKTIHERLDGLGYLPPFAGSKQLRDVEHRVRIEFLVAGDFPGDGLPKPVAFPDPAEVAVDRDGIKVLDLATLIELKLASGMTGGIGRAKDFTDVSTLIGIHGLPASFADELNPYVRDRFLEVWNEVQARPEREP